MSIKEQKKLEMFMAKRNDWLKRFEGDDENTITNKLHDLIWMTAVFRVINASRLYAKQPDGSYMNNGMIQNFIDRCFFEYQFISIRRLLDNHKDKPFSLYTLICDMEKNYHLITRLNYFKAYDIEYDVKKVKKQLDEYRDQQRRAGNNPYYVPNSLIWEQVERRHDIFDKLSDSKSNKRKPTDTVQKKFFENLRNKLDQLEDIKTYANVFIAHSANPDNRKRNNIDNINMTLGKIWDAHEVICKVATLISKTFLNGCGGFLGVTQFDQFENIDKPFIENGNVPELRNVWHEFLRETDSWAYFDIYNYEEFIANDKT